MSIRTRLHRLAGRLKPPVCPEHLPSPVGVKRIDYREGMEVLHSDPEVRLPALERQAEAIRRHAATPPCPTCGWRPGPLIVIRGIVLGETWGTDEPE